MTIFHIAAKGPTPVAGASFILAILFTLQPSILPHEFWSDNIATAEFLGVLTALVVSAVWLHRDAIQPYSLFLATTGLFIGGRFAAHALGFPVPIFSDAAFKPIDLSPAESLQLVSVVLSCLLAIHAGYFAFFANAPSDIRRWPTPTAAQRSTLFPALALVLVCAPLAVLGAVERLSTCLSSGYLGLYAGDASIYASRWDMLARYGLLLGTGLAFTSGNKALQIGSLAALGVVSVIGIATGIRSDFLAFVLLVTWLAHKRIRRYSLIVLVAVPAFMVASAQVASVFSCRAVIATVPINLQTAPTVPTVSTVVPTVPTVSTVVPTVPTVNRAENLAHALDLIGVLAFAHGQGTSLLSIHVASTIKDYPWSGYLQTFIPGFGLAANTVGANLSLPDLYFAQHMAKVWMPDRYAKGEGFGWSIVSDMIVFSGGTSLGVILLSGFLGFVFAALVNAAANSALWFGCLVVLLPKIVLLPRAGLYSIAPYVATFLLIFAAGQYFDRLRNDRNVRAT